MNVVSIIISFLAFLLIVFIISVFYFTSTYKAEVKLLGHKLEDNSEDVISDAMKYFNLTNLIELKKESR